MSRRSVAKTKPAPERTCLRCTKRYAHSRKESFDPKADVCQCVVPVPSLDGKTVEGNSHVTTKRFRDYEFAMALGRVRR